MTEGQTIAGSVITAFIIGASGAFVVGMLFSHGTFNIEGCIGVFFAGAVAAARDYRSLMKLPPVTTGNGNTEQITKQ